jgi:drug/metabolite transporter (DMT)-like permease
VFHFTLLSTVGGAAWMLLIDFHPPRASDWPLLIGIGATATAAQLALTRAYQRGRTLVVGALAYLTVGFAALLGVVGFGETLPPVAWLGMGLVALAGILAARTSEVG